jgi:hypothetical protein
LLQGCLPDQQGSAFGQDVEQRILRLKSKSKQEAEVSQHGAKAGRADYTRKRSLVLFRSALSKSSFAFEQEWAGWAQQSCQQ